MPHTSRRTNDTISGTRTGYRVRPACLKQKKKELSTKGHEGRPRHTKQDAEGNRNLSVLPIRHTGPLFLSRMIRPVVGGGGGACLKQPGFALHATEQKELSTKGHEGPRRHTKQDAEENRSLSVLPIRHTGPLFLSRMIRPVVGGGGGAFLKQPPCAWWPETGPRSRTGQWFIDMDAQDAQDFFWRRRACSPGHPQIRTRSSPESACRAAVSHTDYPVHPVHPCSKIAISEICTSSQTRREGP